MSTPTTDKGEQPTTFRTPSGHEGIRVRMMTPAEMKRYDTLNNRWAARRKLSRKQFDWLMDNRTRYDVTFTVTQTSPI